MVKTGKNTVTRNDKGTVLFFITKIRLPFAVGKFDMVTADPDSITCEIYEIKHSKEAVPAQYRYLTYIEKCSATEFRYGTITRKAVIYRGDNLVDGEVSYINVEEYLKSIGKLLRKDCPLLHQNAKSCS